MNKQFQSGVSLSPVPSAFGPLLFAGRLEEGLNAVSKNRLDVLELSIRSVNDVASETLKPLLKELHLEISSIATGQVCLFDSLCLSAQDDHVREGAVAHIQSMTELAVDLGARGVIIGGIRGKLTGTRDQQKYQYDAGVQAIQKCAQITHEQGVTLLIEPINRYEMNWINTVREGLDVLERIGNPSVKLLLDTFHMNIEETSTLEALKLAGEHLGYVHFADNTRCAPGQGQIDFPAIIQTLLDIRYQGPIVSEILPLPDDLSALRQTAEFWKKMKLKA